MPAKGTKMTAEQIAARQETRDRNRKLGITKRGKPKRSIPLEAIPSEPKRRRKLTRKQKARAIRKVASRMLDDIPRESMEKKMLRMTLATLEIMVELMDQKPHGR